MKFDLIVTRHSALVDYLRELGLIDDTTEVIDHVPYNHYVSGKHVCGVLPHSISVWAKSYTEVPLNVPKELRGEELSLEQVRQYAGEPTTYVVSRKTSAPVTDPFQVGKKVLEMMGYEVSTSGFGYNSMYVHVSDKDGNTVHEESIGL